MGDPLLNDITRQPHLYRNYAGKGVRIRPFWSSWWLRADQRAGLKQSILLIENADAVLKKYTLSLDCVPSPDIFSRPLRTGGLLGDRVVVDCDGLNVPPRSSRWLAGPKEAGTKLYNSFKESLNEENRLIVVFVPLTGPYGYCVLEPEWLPWVLVDPSTGVTRHSNLLLHEIGHACRLGHQLDSPTVTTTRTMEEIQKYYRNVMSWEKIQDQLWNWQVDEIHNSYWCNGHRPRNWFNHANQYCSSGGNCSYLWEQ